MTVLPEQGQELIRQSKGLVTQAVERATEVVGERLAYHVGVARDVGDVLRERGEHPAAGAVDYVADKAENVAYYLRENDAPTMMREAENLLRERGWLLAGAGFVTGMMASRALRAGASVDHYGESRQRSQVL